MQANVFVTPSFRACIADFGLSSIVAGMASILFTNSFFTPRYQAPELLTGGHNNSESDVFALASVVYEVCIRIPFCLTIVYTVWEAIDGKSSVLGITLGRRYNQRRPRGLSTFADSGLCKSPSLVGSNSRLLAGAAGNATDGCSDSSTAPHLEPSDASHKYPRPLLTGMIS
jgi:serine/threonine protein kinase